MSSTIIVFIPFAFEGNPASASGPKCIRELISCNPFFQNTKTVTTEQSYSESAKDYLSRVRGLLCDYTKSYNQVIVIGGNHLCMLPLYQEIYNKGGGIITLDAHRDYYPESSINHATFLKEVSSVKCRHLLLGVRDYKNHSCEHPTAKSAYKVNSSDLGLFFHNSTIDYLDIDIDVLDPTLFCWCGSPIDNGYTIDETKEFISYAKQNGCALFSVSEYIPNSDNSFHGAKIIIDMIFQIMS